ncbi:hypothetical protein Tco_1007496 [Tanacetum coccineum]
MVGSWFRIFKGDNRNRETLLPELMIFFKDKMLLMQAQENGAVLDEEELLFLADECDAFDSDVDDEPTAQSIFMANLSSIGPANLQPVHQMHPSYLSKQVAMYEQRAKFDLTLREQKMDEQMSILIQDHNKKEENLKKELHSVKLQLNSTIKSNMII